MIFCKKESSHPKYYTVMHVKLRFAPFLEIDWLRLDKSSPTKWKNWCISIGKAG